MVHALSQLLVDSNERFAASEYIVNNSIENSVIPITAPYFVGHVLSIPGNLAN
jgi:hypothetical protein